MIANRNQTCYVTCNDKLMNKNLMNNKSLSDSEIIKLFEFLDSETPAALEWTMRYLLRRVTLIPAPIDNMQAIKTVLAKSLVHSNFSTSDINNFARTMNNAWRVRKHRQKKDVGTLSLNLNKIILTQLNEMCHEQKKTEVISMLISGGYSEFLEKKQALKFKLAEERRILKMANDKIKAEKFFKKKLSPAVDESETIKMLKVQNKKLKNDLATLYDLLFSANEHGNPIDDKCLLQATKIYHTATSK